MDTESPGELFPAPRPFFWLPVDGGRHAIVIADRDVPPGGTVNTLCGKRLTRSAVGDTDWFWPTCVTCWDDAAGRPRPPS